MERQGREFGEGSGSNPAESVNAQLLAALTQMTEYFEKQDTRIGRLEQPILETADDVALERFQKFRPQDLMENVKKKWLKGGLKP